MSEGPNVLIELWPVTAHQGKIWAMTQGAPLLSPPLTRKQSPDEMVSSLLEAERLRGETLLWHSTSWRHDPFRSAVLLTYVAAMQFPANRIAWDEVRPPDGLITPSNATAAVVHSPEEVLWHALRHVSFLVHNDAVVNSTLGATWSDAVDRLPFTLAGQLKTCS